MRNTERYRRAARMKGVLANYRQRNEPLPIWLAEELDVDPNITYDASATTQIIVKKQDGKFAGFSNTCANSSKH